MPLDNNFTNNLAQQEELPNKTQEKGSKSVKHIRHMTTLERITVQFLAVLMVIGGVLLGVFIGTLWSFSACWKEDCSPLIGSSWIWIPVVSLFFTVPLSKKIFRYVERNRIKSINNS